MLLMSETILILVKKLCMEGFGILEASEALEVLEVNKIVIILS